MDCNVDLGQGWLGGAPPVVDPLEGERLLGGVRRHVEGAGPNHAAGLARGDHLGPPVLGVGLNRLLVDDRAGAALQRPGREAPAAGVGQRDLYGVRVGRSQAAHLEAGVVGRQLVFERLPEARDAGAVLAGRRRPGRLLDRSKACDRAQIGDVGALQRGGAIPGVEHVLRGERIAVVELDVWLQVDGEGQTIRRNTAVGLRWYLGGEVRDEVELVIEPPQIVEDVLADLGIDLGVGFTRIEGSGALVDREFQHLAGGEAAAAGGAATVAARGEQQHSDRAHAQGELCRS